MRVSSAAEMAGRVAADARLRTTLNQDSIAYVGGIVVYVGRGDARELLMAWAEKLEYRGYDSAGISVSRDIGSMRCARSANLDALRARSTPAPTADYRSRWTWPRATAVGWTRYGDRSIASGPRRGRVSRAKRPARTSTGRPVCYVVRQLIVENYVSLKRRWPIRAPSFTSETRF